MNHGVCVCVYMYVCVCVCMYVRAPALLPPTPASLSFSFSANSTFVDNGSSHCHPRWKGKRVNLELIVLTWNDHKNVKYFSGNQSFVLKFMLLSVKVYIYFIKFISQSFWRCSCKYSCNLHFTYRKKIQIMSDKS